MKAYLYSLLFLSILFASGCRSYSITERSNEFLSKKKPEKILVLPLDFIDLNLSELDDVEGGQSKGIQIMTRTMKKAFSKIEVEGIFLEAKPNENTADMFKYSIPLKKDLLGSSELHDDIFEQRSRKIFSQKLFAQIPRIQPNYSALFDKYGTRYVLFTGIFSNKNQHFQYVILTDIVKSEIVFRNLKFVAAKASKSNIEPILYDTFLSLYK